MQEKKSHMWQKLEEDKEKGLKFNLCEQRN